MNRCLLLCCLTGLLLTSCSIGNKSFLHRKYLHLHSASSFSPENEPDSSTAVTVKDDSDQACDTLVTKDEQIRLVTIISETDEFLRFSDCPESQIVYEISMSSVNHVGYASNRAEQAGKKAGLERKAERAYVLAKYPPGTPERIRNDYKTKFYGFLNPAIGCWTWSALIFIFGLLILLAEALAVSLFCSVFAAGLAIIGMILGCCAAAFRQARAEEIIEQISKPKE